MRLSPPRDPVTITLDGEKVTAERGEPIAAALVAAGKLALARSSKFHRPRGPSCFRAACDGCLARVDGQPNVMTCLARAQEGSTIEAQNALGSREIDLLRMTDWFFPEGMNHHELFAGVPGVQQVMQAFARRVAGLGKLPARAVKARDARRRQVDALVIGAGAAGMAAAAALAAKGRAVEVVDDALEAGGGSTALVDDGSFAAVRTRFGRSGATLRQPALAAAIYGDDVLIVDAHGAEVVTARAVVLAPGAHDGVVAFEGNDVPGVMSARAAGWLLARGIAVGERVVVAVPEGGGPFGEAFARAVEAKRAPVDVTLLRGEPVHVRGSSRVKGATVHVRGKDITRACDALLVDAPRSPAYELCEQAGAKLVHEPRGFVVQTEGGKIRGGFFAVGEVTGAPLDAARFEEQAERVARAM